MAYNLETVVSWAKRRGFVYPGSDIYQGLANAWDLGPYGSLLRKNILDIWVKEFVQKRKRIIIEKLKENELYQQDLGKLLGHRKNYMSELINGIRPFSRDDLVIIHRILNIELKYLISPFIKFDTAKHINKVLTELNRKRMKLNKTDLDFAV